jgi:hypothetical protein
MQRIASFAVGAFVGAAALLALRGHDLDLVYLQMAKLRVENNQLQEEVDSLKNDLANRQKQSVRKVRKIEVTAEAPDEFTKLSIAKYVKERTRPLLEKELGYLDGNPQLITGLVDGRICTVQNQPYLIDVESVIIGETLYVWVKGTKQVPVTP